MPQITHPINAFPESLQGIIAHYSEVKGYPTEFFITTMLSACSTALGRSFILNTGNFKAIGVVWSAVICKPGMTKSPALDDAFEPINKYQAAIFSKWKADKEEFDEMKRNNPKDKSEMYDPQLIILNDVTPEALTIGLSRNPKGCGIVYDELAGFVGRFNRYNSGADEQMFLSLFNGGGINRIRVNSNSNAYIAESFLTIVGTIQPTVLKEVFNGRTDSGFFDRWLLCFPDDLKKQYPSFHGIQHEYRQAYFDMVYRILHIQYDPNSVFEMEYSAESYRIVNDYQRKLIDTENDTDNDSERALLAKMEIYLHRFALLIHVIELALQPTEDWLKNWRKVSESAAKGAIILCEYYIKEAHKLRVITPVEALKDQWRPIYDALPGAGVTFDRQKFMSICQKHDIKQRTADSFLKLHSDKTEKSLFFKVSHGLYTKNIF